jgi:hypothetical protein
MKRLKRNFFRFLNPLQKRELSITALIGTHSLRNNKSSHPSRQKIGSYSWINNHLSEEIRCTSTTIKLQ